MAMPVARPHSTEAAVKTTNPVHSIRLAPKRSPRAPAGRISAASTRVYALTTHCSPVMPPPNEAPISFTATLTTVTSSWITPNPRLVAIRVAVSAQLSGRRGGAGVVMVAGDEVMPRR